MSTANSGGGLRDAHPMLRTESGVSNASVNSNLRTHGTLDRPRSSLSDKSLAFSTTSAHKTASNASMTGGTGMLRTLKGLFGGGAKPRSASAEDSHSFRGANYAVSNEEMWDTIRTLEAEENLESNGVPEGVDLRPPSPSHLALSLPPARHLSADEGGDADGRLGGTESSDGDMYEMSSEAETDPNSEADLALSPSAVPLLQDPRLPNLRHQLLSAEVSNLQNRPVPQFFSDFEADAAEEGLIVAEVRVEEARERERERDRERKRDADRLVERHQAYMKSVGERESSAASGLVKVYDDRQKQKATLHSRKVGRFRQALTSMRRQFSRSRKQVLKVLSERKRAVNKQYGRLYDADDYYGESGDHTRLSWYSSQRKVKVHLKMVRAVKDKLPRGRYVMLVSLYERLGGATLPWTPNSSAYAEEFTLCPLHPKKLQNCECCQGIVGMSMPFDHSGGYSDLEVSIAQNLYTVCPSVTRMKPYLCFVFELVLLGAKGEGDVESIGSSSGRHKVVAWGVFPMSDPKFDVVHGKQKTPLVRGHVDLSVDSYDKFERLYHSNLENWIGNLYFEVLPFPRMKRQFDPLRFKKYIQREREIELGFTSEMLSVHGEEREGSDEEGEGEREGVREGAGSDDTASLSDGDAGISTDFTDTESNSIYKLDSDQEALLSTLLQSGRDTEKERDAAGERDTPPERESDTSSTRPKRHSLARYNTVSSPSLSPQTSATSFRHLFAQHSTFQRFSDSPNVKVNQQSDGALNQSLDSATTGLPKQPSDSILPTPGETERSSEVPPEVRGSESLPEGVGGGPSLPRQNSPPRIGTHSRLAKQAMLSSPRLLKTTSLSELPGRERERDGETEREREREEEGEREKGKQSEAARGFFSNLKVHIDSREALDRAHKEVYKQRHTDDQEGLHYYDHTGDDWPDFSDPEEDRVRKLRVALLPKVKHKSRFRSQDSTHARKLEAYRFDIRQPQGYREKRQSTQKMSYMLRALAADLGFHDLRSLEFYGVVALLVISLYVRIFLHYLGQYVFLAVYGVHIEQYEIRPYRIDLVYQSDLLPLWVEFAVVALGPLANILVLALLVFMSWLSQRLLGSFIDYGSRFIITFGVAAILDPYLIFLVDWATNNTEMGDVYKVFHVISSREDGNDFLGYAVVALLYAWESLLAFFVLYGYFVRIHMNGVVIDVYHRLHANRKSYLVPNDMEVSYEELQYICEEAEKYRGPNGERRKTLVLEYETTDQLHRKFRETSIHVLIYDIIPIQQSILPNAQGEIEMTDQRRIYRQFLLLPDGMLIELALDVDSLGSTEYGVLNKAFNVKSIADVVKGAVNITEVRPEGTNYSLSQLIAVNKAKNRFMEMKKRIQRRQQVQESEMHSRSKQQRGLIRRMFGKKQK